MRMSEDDLRTLLREATDDLHLPTFQPDRLMEPRRTGLRFAALSLGAAAAAAAGIIAIAETSGPADRLSPSPAVGGEASPPECPKTIAAAGSLTNDRNGVQSQLVPDRPTGGRLCRYTSALSAHGNVPAGSLNDEARFSRAQAAHLTEILNAVKMVPGVRHCPVDTETWDIVYFVYKHGSSVQVRIDTSGCTSFDNGHVRVGGTSPETYAYLTTADDIAAAAA